RSTPDSRTGQRPRRRSGRAPPGRGRRVGLSSRSLLVPALAAQPLALLGRHVAQPLALLGRHGTQALALFRRHALDALARLRALLRRHPLPAMVILHHALALLRGQLLELAVALLDPLAPLRRQALEALIGLLQLFPACLGQLVPAPEVIHDLPPLLRRQRAEALEPLSIVLEDALALLRRHVAPALEVTLDHGPLVGCQRVEARHLLRLPRLSRRLLGLGPRAADGTGDDRQQQQRGENAAAHVSAPSRPAASVTSLPAGAPAERREVVGASTV